MGLVAFLRSSDGPFPYLHSRPPQYLNSPTDIEGGILLRDLGTQIEGPEILGEAYKYLFLHTFVLVAVSY